MAVTVYDNTGLTVGAGSSPIYASATLAFSFTSDSNASDALSQIQIGLYDSTPADGGTVTLTLYADSGLNTVGTAVGTLAVVADSTLGTTNSTTVTITPSSSYTLTASTRYWIGAVSTTGSLAREAFVAGFGGTTGVAGEYAQSFSTTATNASNSGAYVAALQESPACFARGTLIATDRGQLPVELLQAGDLVALARGGVARVAWLGWRQIDAPSGDEQPIRIAAGAFGQGLPQRDLLVSPEHAVFAQGVLVPTRALLGCPGIRQASVPKVSYFHILLDRHDVILAEGLPCETLLDPEEPHRFANGDTAPPSLAFLNPCAPRVTQGVVLEQVRRTLGGRATVA